MQLHDTLKLIAHYLLIYATSWLLSVYPPSFLFSTLQVTPTRIQQGSCDWDSPLDDHWSCHTTINWRKHPVILWVWHKIIPKTTDNSIFCCGLLGFKFCFDGLRFQSMTSLVLLFFFSEDCKDSHWGRKGLWKGINWLSICLLLHLHFSWINLDVSVASSRKKKQAKKQDIHFQKHQGCLVKMKILKWFNSVAWCYLPRCIHPRNFLGMILIVKEVKLYYFNVTIIRK